MSGNDLEVRLYASQFSTGLLELFVGLGLVVLGLGWLGDLVAVSAIAPMLAILLWKPVNQRLVEPRIGSAVFGEARRSREQKGHWALVGLGVFFLLAGLVAVFFRDGGFGVDLGVLVAGLPAAILAVGAVASGALFGIHRLYWHAAPLLGAGTLGVLFEWHPGWIFLASGSVLVAVGAVVFGRFLTGHPKLEDPVV